MSPRLYRLYRFLTGIKKKVHRRTTAAGRLMIVFAALSVLFGFNTRLTMIYQLAALSIALLLVSFPLSLFFSTAVKIRRMLPETCTAGQKLTYLLAAENTAKRAASGLVFREASGAEYPTFAEFSARQEEGESDRNIIDRKFGYYRWLWLLEQNAGARFESFPLPLLPPGARMQVEVSLMPLRRGYVQLGGYSLHRLEPFGLFKKEIFFSDTRKLLVLPKLYPVIQADFSGSRKYHQGGMSSAPGCGETGEFVSLREYRAGDPVKHIDWKATARVGDAIVRQYQDEYFSRYGILLDTFTERENEVFEDAVSVAASIIARQDSARNLIDLLFACDSCVSSVSLGRGESALHHMLEVLACISTCRCGKFSDLAELVTGHAGMLSGLILVLLTIDEERRHLLDYLVSRKIPHRVLLISGNSESSRQQLRDISLQNIKVFDVDSEIKVVDLR